MSFEHCQSCLPPKRHPGCHSDCPYYQVDIAKHNEARQTQEKDDYLSARHFKTRRYQRLK